MERLTQGLLRAGRNPEEQPQPAFLCRAKAGDADVWEALYRRAYPRLFAYTRRRLESDHEADDAVSETMLRALNRIATFTWKGAGIDAWLYGIARNVASVL